MSINFPSGGYNYAPSGQDLPLYRSRRSTDNEIIVTIPLGASYTAKREGNNTTTIEFTWANGVKESWNSGQFITCRVLSTGFALAGTIGGPALSTLLGLLSAGGCSYAFSNASQDGDS